MAHIGVKRFAAGHRQHDRAQRDEGGPGLVGEQAQRHRRGLAAQQNLRRSQDGDRAQHREHDEPQHHHRPEQLADLFGAAALQQRTGRPGSTSVSGTTKGVESAARPTLRPSSADSTEIAGVSMPSP